MYYRFDVDAARMNTRLEAETNRWVSLSEGKLIAEAEFQVPHVLTMSVDADLFDEEAEGEIKEEPLFYAYYPAASVMDQALIAALRSAGVDNLQTFPAVVKCPQLGREFSNYEAVNIVGLVSCANAAQSESSPLADLKFFHRLAIDESQARGLLMFRLAESQIDIIVRDCVVEKIKPKNFLGLVLSPLS